LDTNLEISTFDLVCLSSFKQPISKYTSLGKYTHELVCSIPNKLMDSQSHTYSLVINQCNIVCSYIISWSIFDHYILTLKLFYVCYRWVFYLGGKPP